MHARQCNNGLPTYIIPDANIINFQHENEKRNENSYLLKVTTIVQNHINVIE